MSSVLRELIDEPSLREFVATGEKIGERYRLAGDFVDLFHVNTLAIVPRTFSDTFQKGFVLFAARNLNLIGVIDPERESLVWSWGTDELDWPHQPTLLDNGNLLVFDNGFHRSYSRIVELEPSSGDIVWEYQGDPPSSFSSKIMGGVQGLPNGNVLVTESLRGHAFEITRSGELVWEFFNPDVDADKDKRATLYRVQRLPLDYLDR
jgi:outer membrane protein assembly factor BamB